LYGNKLTSLREALIAETEAKLKKAQENVVKIMQKTLRKRKVKKISKNNLDEKVESPNKEMDLARVELRPS
jgi:hypothetical protein